MPAEGRPGRPGRGALALRGLGMRLPGVLAPDDLARQIAGRAAPPRTVRRFAAPYTDLEPVERWVPGPVEPRMPAHVAPRGLRNLPPEPLLALAAAADTAAGADGWGEPTPGPTAVLWASSTAGLAEYGTICVEAAVLDPGLSSPLIGPASAFNGPAATVSIRLGLHGPNETLTGGTAAGMSALAEAGRLLADGEADRALVGASATVSRWSLPAQAGALAPGEGAACLALAPWQDGDAGIALGGCRRTGLDPSRLPAAIRELAATAGRPAAIVVSAPDPALVEALSADQPAPVWHVEGTLGDFGAAGGLLAVVCAIAHCAGGATSVLALAVEPSGNAAIMEVSSC